MIEKKAWQVWENLKGILIPVSLLLLFLMIGIVGEAQPVIYSKRVIADVVTYQDYYKPDVFYYLPSTIRLATKPGGKPAFKLIEMRYTGTKSSDDAGEKRFLNIAKFTINVQPIKKPAIELIAQELAPGKKIKLKPLPTLYVETVVIAPYFNEKGDQTTSISGSSGMVESFKGKSLLTEKTFTLKLDNQQAEILWKQVDEGHMALSIGYAFFAKAFQGTYRQFEATGDSAFIAHFANWLEKDSTQLANDTTLVTHLVEANAFSIEVDLVKWPELMKKIDLNSEETIAYPVLEVRCYDFKENLRPDLYKKQFEIKSMSAAEREVTFETTFSGKTPEAAVKVIDFPYAVKITEPFQTRVREISREGEITISSWITHTDWVSIIDITTPENEIPFEEKTVEVEIDPEQLEEMEMEKVRVTIRFNFAGKAQTKELTFELPEDTPLKSLTCRHDKNETIKVAVTWFYQDGNEITEEEKILTDDYLFIKPNEE